MTLITTISDRLLSRLAPRRSADASSCFTYLRRLPNGCTMVCTVCDGVTTCHCQGVGCICPV